jgi:hypothetical protein
MSGTSGFSVRGPVHDSKPKYSSSITHPNGPITLRLGQDQWRYNIIEISARGGKLLIWISQKGNRIYVYPQNDTGEAWLLMEHQGEQRLMSSTERGWQLNASGEWVDDKGEPWKPGRTTAW